MCVTERHALTYDLEEKSNSMLLDNGEDSAAVKMAFCKKSSSFMCHYLNRAFIYQRPRKVMMKSAKK
jgi:hypothetical protein